MPIMFPHEALKRLAANGDELIETIGGYIPAVRQIQDIDLALQSQCAKNVRGGRNLFASTSEKII